jgi:GTP-binding protein
MLAAVSNAPPVKILAAELLTSAAGPEGFPKHAVPEIAFLGRSNVGKSSLLNRLLARRSLARTSHTPGRTRLVNFFRVLRPEGELCFVDLPGYGYAKVSKRERRAWQALIESYLEKREQLRLAVLLQDARRDPGRDEIDLVAWLRERGVRVVGAATKWDRLGAAERVERERALADAGAGLDWILSSSRTGAGIAALWREIERALDAAEEGH